MKWQERISVDPKVCHGKPCIKGTRVLVSVVLANVAVGEPFESIMSGYHIQREDIQVVLRGRPCPGSIPSLGGGGLNVAQDR